MEINILIEEEIEVEAGADWLQAVMEKTLRSENTPDTIEISLVITGQEQIRALNRDYRGKDQATDVLSFALQETKQGEESTVFIGPPDGLLHLGEIIISYPQAVIQAAEHSHPVKKEMAALIIHGTLHVLGYDHEKPEMELAMTARESELMKTMEKDLI
jgi:probable rRNA maturation factor